MIPARDRVNLKLSQWQEEVGAKESNLERKSNKANNLTLKVIDESTREVLLMML